MHIFICVCNSIQCSKQLSFLCSVLGLLVVAIEQRAVTKQLSFLYSVLVTIASIDSAERPRVTSLIDIHSTTENDTVPALFHFTPRNRDVTRITTWISALLTSSIAQKHLIFDYLQIITEKKILKNFSKKHL